MKFNSYDEYEDLYEECVMKPIYDFGSPELIEKWEAGLIEDNWYEPRGVEYVLQSTGQVIAVSRGWDFYEY